MNNTTIEFRGALKDIFDKIVRKISTIQKEKQHEEKNR